MCIKVFEAKMGMKSGFTCDNKEHFANFLAFPPLPSLPPPSLFLNAGGVSLYFLLFTLILGLVLVHELFVLAHDEYS